jgi:hypothetical protein
MCLSEGCIPECLFHSIRFLFLRMEKDDILEYVRYKEYKIYQNLQNFRIRRNESGCQSTFQTGAFQIVA